MDLCRHPVSRRHVRVVLLRRPVTIEPAVPASVAFEGSHQIVFEPKVDLLPGIYRVHVPPQGWGSALRPAAPWLREPMLAMRRVQVCRDDGFLANDLCEPISESLDIAPGSHLVTIVDGDGNLLSRSFEVREDASLRRARRCARPVLTSVGGVTLFSDRLAGRSAYTCTRRIVPRGGVIRP
jgi:hypothetical protein